MDIQQEVRAAEKALAKAGVSIRQFCFMAGIEPETWRIWRDGRGLPQLLKWEQAMETLRGIRTGRRMTVAKQRAALKTETYRIAAKKAAAKRTARKAQAGDL